MTSTKRTSKPTAKPRPYHPGAKLRAAAKRARRQAPELPRTPTKPPGPGLQAAAAAGAAFAWSPNVSGTGETMAPRGIERDAITAGILTPGTWSIIGGARDDARARAEVQAAVIAVEALRRSIAARAGRGADAPPIDVIERARALFAPDQVPLRSVVGDLLLDMIGEIERLRGTSTPGGAPPRFYDLQSADQVKLVDIERASNGSPYGTTRLQVLRLIEEREIPGGGRHYFLTPAGQRVLDDWREAETRARQGALLRGLTAEAARHAQVLAGINTEFQAAEAQGPRRRSPT